MALRYLPVKMALPIRIVTSMLVTPDETSRKADINSGMTVARRSLMIGQYHAKDEATVL